MQSDALFKLKISNYEFSPSWFSMVLTFLAFVCFLWLGFWQLHRAHEKIGLQQQYNRSLHQAPLDLNREIVGNDFSSYRYLPVKVTGKFDSGHQFLLDNKIFQHQAGFYVLTPFQIVNSNKTVLINRGWIPQPANRQILPKLSVGTDEVTITGLLELPYDQAFSLGSQPDNLVWPRIIERVDLEKMFKLTNYSFYNFIVLLNPSEKFGFVRAWSPKDLSPHVNYGYAFQWFSFAVVSGILFLVMNSKKL